MTPRERKRSQEKTRARNAAKKTKRQKAERQRAEAREAAQIKARVNLETTRLEDVAKRAQAIRDRMFANAPRPGEAALKLRTARAEEASANAEKIRRKMFGEAKLEAAAAKTKAYADERKKQVRLSSARIEETQARAAEIRRKLFGLEESKGEVEAAKKEGVAPAKGTLVEQEPRAEGAQRGRLQGAFRQEAFETWAALQITAIDLLILHFDQYREEVAEEFGGAGLEWLTPYQFGVRILALRSIPETAAEFFRPYKERAK